MSLNFMPVGLTWTREEDALLLSLKREGRRWPYIMARLPGRTRAAAETRWHSLKKTPPCEPVNASKDGGA